MAVGEQVLNLEERLGYVHKGIEKLAEGRDPAGLSRLAGRVSGDTTVAHTWAACMAMERAANVDPPPRARILRGILAERERIANHLGDIGALCNDVAFTFAYYQFTRLREDWLRNNQAGLATGCSWTASSPGAWPSIQAITCMPPWSRRESHCGVNSMNCGPCSMTMTPCRTGS